MESDTSAREAGGASRAHSLLLCDVVTCASAEHEHAGILMSIALHHDGGNLYRVEIRGTLRKAELEGCEERLAAELARLGRLRLLFVLTGFHGWESRSDWNDLSFYLKHGDAIERIAIVGPPRWRSQALMFAGADLRRAPVKFFPVGTDTDAREWLSS